MSRVRIGVFICHCGTNIGGIVNIKEIIPYALNLPLVKHVEDNLYTCSDSGLSSIKRMIKEKNLNRVVVASCTPRTHEELFRRTCEEAGLNRYLFEFVNIREHCSWIHLNEPKAATKKALELIRMGVVKAAHLMPLEAASADVLPVSLIVGGGTAGLISAYNLAKQGFKVYLVEREDKLGGIAAGLWKLLPGDRPAEEFVSSLIGKVKENKNIIIFQNSTVEDISGFIGSFQVNIKRAKDRKEIKVGTIIIATGARELEPLGLYRLGDLKGILTQRQLEESLRQGTKNFSEVVFINCAGARIPEREYCGRFCCATSIKNSRYLREICPSARVTVLQNDVMAFGTEFELEYRKAQEAGVRFIRYNLQKPPKIIGDSKVEGVAVFHSLAGEEITLQASTVVLTTPLIPAAGAVELAQMIKVPLDTHGFFLEAHLKLRPVEFATDGIFIAGSARFPVDLRETVTQGMAAAAKAAAPMKAGTITLEATTAKTDVFLCSGCGNCKNVCPFAAIEMEQDKNEKIQSRVNSVLCKGCGACNAACPNGAIQQLGFTDLQIFSMVETLALEGELDAWQRQ